MNKAEFYAAVSHYDDVEGDATDEWTKEMMFIDYTKDPTQFDWLLPYKI